MLEGYSIENAPKNACFPHSGPLWLDNTDAFALISPTTWALLFKTNGPPRIWCSLVSVSCDFRDGGIDRIALFAHYNNGFLCDAKKGVYVWFPL